MTTETRTDPRKNFAPRFLPWLLTVASFAFYWFTLNRWVSPFNLQARRQNFRLDLAAGDCESDFISRHLSLSLAAGGANSDWR